MIATPLVPSKKMKIKFTTNKIGASAAFKFQEQASVTEKRDRSSLCGSIKSEKSDLQKWKICPKKDILADNCSKTKSSGASKRGPQTILECHNAKRPRMDRSLSARCTTILLQLMRHPTGWIFSKPVDPVALKIPDYFDIISQPMDLGTVKEKLGRNMYSEAREFAADVRLTFSNAMLYNPPGNSVHTCAKELNDIFEGKWKFVEEKLSRGDSGANSEETAAVQKNSIHDTGVYFPERSPMHRKLLSKTPISVGKDKKSLHVRIIEAEPPTLSQKGAEDLGKNSVKATKCAEGLRKNSVKANAKRQLRPVATKCSVCWSSACQCRLSHDSGIGSSSDTSSEKPLGRERQPCSAIDSKSDSHSQITSTSQISKSDPDSDGATSAFDDPPAADDASREEYTSVLDVPLSPRRALRAAMLKSRFASTILKAQKKTLLDHDVKVNPAKLQLEKERLEMKQREEKARIEAQIKAAEAASQRMESELIKQRQKEREAARLALQKMGRTVDLELNVDMMKELEKLCGCPLSYHPDSPLKQLGLYIKDEYIIDEEEIIAGEEGEILR